MQLAQHHKGFGKQATQMREVFRTRSRSQSGWRRSILLGQKTRGLREGWKGNWRFETCVVCEMSTSISENAPKTPAWWKRSISDGKNKSEMEKSPNKISIIDGYKLIMPLCWKKKMHHEGLKILPAKFLWCRQDATSANKHILSLWRDVWWWLWWGNRRRQRRYKR